MIINNIAVHKIIKTTHQQRPTIAFSDSELDISDSDILDFGESLAKTYFDKKSRFYTIFKVEENIEPPFKEKLDSYLTTNEFYIYSRQVTQILCNKMSEETLSRGGYVVVMNYESTNNNKYIFIALLNNKENFSVNDSLEIIKNLSLNIEKMAMASIINISRYQASRDNYITFLKGLREIPDYFISFIGANKETRRDIREVSASWVTAIEDYMENKEVSIELIEQRTVSLLTQIKNYNRNEDIITADIIANIISPNNPSDFIEFVYNEDSNYELPSEMDRMDTQVLNRLNVVNYVNKAKGFSLKFKRKDIGNIVNINENSISITDQDIISEIKDAINE